MIINTKWKKNKLTNAVEFVFMRNLMNNLFLSVLWLNHIDGSKKDNDLWGWNFLWQLNESAKGGKNCFFL